ncbi:MAG: glutamate decarboxylase [Peptococcaceae bacterium]|jgi:hypothetical protein|nr:glutamate decarboxylase [Peptococcaceae bacterium]
MWTVIYIAPNQVAADQYKALLEMEGILVMKRPLSVPQLGHSGPVELLVTESEAAEAAEVLAAGFIVRQEGTE